MLSKVFLEVLISSLLEMSNAIMLLAHSINYFNYLQFNSELMVL